LHEKPQGPGPPRGPYREAGRRLLRTPTRVARTPGGSGFLARATSRAGRRAADQPQPASV